MIGTKSREAQNPASCIVRVFGDLRFHTDGDLLAVAFAASGQRLASAGEDKVVALWALDADDPLGRLVGHQDRIQALLWHPDGRRLISAGWDATARVWDTSTADLAFLLNYHAAQLT